MYLTFPFEARRDFQRASSIAIAAPQNQERSGSGCQVPRRLKPGPRPVGLRYGSNKINGIERTTM